MTSIHDVARRTGVSIATVSRALRGLPNVSPRTRELVQAAAAELGYVPSPSASGLSGGRHRAVALVIPSTGRWFYNRVVEGADSVLRGEGFDTFLVILAATMRNRQDLFRNALLRKRSDAVIALGIDFTVAEKEELRDLEMPAAVVGSAVPGVHSVGVDDAAAATAAVEHLLGLGHRRIGHIGGETAYGMDRSVGEDRSTAWREALERHGIAPHPSWHGLGQFLMPPAKAATTRMLHGEEPPTAIFAGSDEMAFGVLVAAAELGLRVPEDLSVIGIDDHDWSESYGLTTIRQDPYEQGRTAARTVLDALAGVESPILTRRSGFELVLRRSTGPLPRG
ncbi:LacI family DNA-binding transcriptional regulator [Amnibacterium setariae]|uniref:LacI family transcriptional regulator n=1 Tax=Amnibacterium setariae TaxID=2306585 RepID=A0A3A1TRY5_9MICO|nr:LacI family DNA-binding transcriptional regulator [Amnibacterium setariae]RIX26455.1 LacI family transcriptional regulator [Amnibacterium setariae]